MSNFFFALAFTTTVFYCYCRAQSSSLSSLTRGTSIKCGATHTCFNVDSMGAAPAGTNSNSGGGASEPKLLAFKNSSSSGSTESIDFTVIAVRPQWLLQKYAAEADNWGVAVGFNKKPSMENTTLISCIYDGVSNPLTPTSYVYGLYAVYKKSPREVQGLTRAVRNSAVNMSGNNTLTCSFTLPRTFMVEGQRYDLANKVYHISLARVYGAGRSTGYHYADKAVTEQTGLMMRAGNATKQLNLYS